ncbi:hypothetical protein EC973_005116 [Apophysomyces ossiformis]|uniref:non-specific serine/threonine protein kinase n=1 Tax=Apophysomyces ossiformis TaxID=679940 RepID=A0A8H7EK82_9FUNG|nr:hypothetical protein EC973_005116 [Apophysomyces ossiformis]
MAVYGLRSKTPPQFVFNKPRYDGHYEHTHYHHLRKTNLIHLRWKAIFRRRPRELINPKNGEFPFANEFNHDIKTRYGRWGELIGEGSGGSIRLIHGKNGLLAAKQFRKRLPHENEKEYIKKVTAEFCIGSILRHPNIIRAFDMVQQDTKFYEIMEYAPNGMFSIVLSGRMSTQEIACCWRQLLNGLEYLQSVGIAHRDLKLDNLMLDNRAILKIIDFGCADVVRYPHETKTHASRGIYGSDPYIAPEMYDQPLYDANKVDVWSCGIIFVCMTIRRFPWKVSKPLDPAYDRFITEGPQWLLSHLPLNARPIMARILEPEPARRCALNEVLADEWVNHIDVCTTEYPGDDHCHHLSNKSTTDGT